MSLLRHMIFARLCADGPDPVIACCERLSLALEPEERAPFTEAMVMLRGDLMDLGFGRHVPRVERLIEQFEQQGVPR